jgi:hypothetical protein
LTSQVFRRFGVAVCLFFLIFALFFTYFIVILRQRGSQQADLALNAFLGIMVSLFILFLDTLATIVSGVFVSFEKHFSSVGRNWKRISYFSIFVIFNGVAAILAYCLSQPLNEFFEPGNHIFKWQNTSYRRSYDEWYHLCSVGPRSSHNIIAELNSRIINNDIQMTIGYWHYFTSQKIDGHIVPAFAYNRIQGPLSFFYFYQVGCDSRDKYICSRDPPPPQNPSPQNPLPRIQRHADSCAFISNLSSFAGESLPNVSFSAAINHVPWSDNDKVPRFSLRSFAEEGSLYGFLFAFIILKAIRIAFFYVYNDFISVVSHRLLLPLLKRLGYDPNVRSNKQSATSIKHLIIYAYISNLRHLFASQYLNILSYPSLLNYPLYL